MAKLPHQSTVPPTTDQDAATKAYSDASGGGPGSDTTAIHDDTAGEINAVALKATPVAADVILIEDSADSFNKKKATLTDLLGGGSSGPIAAAQGDYLAMYLSADQTATLAVDDPVKFDTVDGQSGDLALDGVTNVGRISGLKAGRSYELQAQVRSSTTASIMQYRWYDVTAAVYVGQSGLSYAADISNISSSPEQARHFFRPSVDSEVELRILSVSPTSTDILANPVNPVTYATVVEIGAVQADVVGGLEFMDKIEVTAPQTTVSFGAAGDGVFQRALDGEIDEEYICRFKIVIAQTNSAFRMDPEGISTGKSTEAINAVGGVVSGGAGTSWQFAGANGNAEEAHGEFRFRPKTGGVRNWVADQTLIDTSAFDTLHYLSWRGAWSDTSTPITFLDIVATIAGGIGAGSTFELFRLTTANLRADSAAVYERMSMETVDPGALVTTERTVGHSIYGGSIVGVSVRVEDAVTAGSITVNVKAGGVTKLTAVLDTTNSTSKVERLAIGIAKFSADENISVEFVPSSYDNAGSVASPVTVQVHMTNGALITQNDRVVARTVLSANATTLALTGIDGDLDEEYEIVGRLDLVTTAHSLDIALNGTSANLSTGRINNGGGIINDTAGLFLGSGAVSGENEISFRMRFFAKRGNMRRGFEAASIHTFSSGTIHVDHHTGVLLDESANITTMDFVSTTASGILAGSWVEVRRIKA